MPAIGPARSAAAGSDIETAAKALDVWQSIYEKDIAMMER